MKNKIGTTLVSILRSVFLCSRGSTSMSRLFLYASYVSSRRDEVSDATVGEGCTTSMSLSVEGIVTKLMKWGTGYKHLKRRHGNLLKAIVRLGWEEGHSFSERLLHGFRVDKYRSLHVMSFVQDKPLMLPCAWEQRLAHVFAIPRSWSLSRMGAKGLLTAASLAWTERVGSLGVEMVLLMFDVVIACWVDDRHSVGTGKDRRLQVAENHH
jgi:hypothetical protein